MVRLVRLLTLMLLVALALPVAASAAPRMWMGFQDDLSSPGCPSATTCATRRVTQTPPW